MPNSTHIFRIALTVCLAFNWPSSTAEEWSTSATLVTEKVVDGISHSFGRPLAQIHTEWNSTSGFFVGATGFTGSKEEGRIRNRGYALTAGYFFPLSDHNAIELSVNHVDYIGPIVNRWEYQEYALQFYFSRNLSISYVYSPDYLGFNYTSAYTGLAWQPQLSQRFYLKAAVGNHQYGESASIKNLPHIGFGLGMQLDDWSASFSYHYADREGVQIFGSGAVEDHWVLEINYLIF